MNIVNEAFAIVCKERDDALEKLAKLRVENDHNWQAVADLEKMTQLARELRNALKELADNGHTEECDNVNYANKHCDCGVDSARILISKAKEVLP